MMNNIDYATHYEAMPPFDGGFRIGFSTFAKLTTMRPHWHEHLEFVYITGGTGTFIINGKHFPVAPGDLIVANPNTLHALLSDRGIDYHCLLVFLDFFDKDDIDVLGFQSLVQCDATVREIFEELQSEYKDGNTAASLMKKALVYRLVEPPAHNRIVIGSSPIGSTIQQKRPRGNSRPFLFNLSYLSASMRSMKRDLSCFWARLRLTAGILSTAPSRPASRRWLKSMRLSKIRS